MRSALPVAMAALLMCACATSPEASATARSMQVVILGTGTPHPDPERSGPAVAVVRGDRAYIFDAGPGIVRRAAAAAQAHDVAALRPVNLSIVFLTHLHSDHTLGLPDLMLSPFALRRETPLRVYGPPGSARMTEHILSAYEQDIRHRIDGLEQNNDTGWRAPTVEIEAPGIVYEEDGVRIEAFEVLHGTWAHAYGYRISDGETTIVISGDARVSPALIEAARGADILVHEVFSTSRFEQLPPAYQAYHGSFHTSTRELADIARETRPDLVVMYHQLYWGATDEDLVNEMRTYGYDGAVVSASDLDIY